MLFVTTLTSCGFFESKIEVKNADFDKASTPDIILNDYQTTAYNEGSLRWILNSKQAQVFETKKVTYMKKIDFKNYNFKNQVSSSALAKRGFANNETQDLTLLDDVSIVNSEQTLIEGDYFFWDDDKRWFTSTNWVTITKADGSVIRGLGFKSDQNLGNIVFEKQVSGEINSSDNEDDGFFEGF